DVSRSGGSAACSGLAPAPYKLFSSTTDFPAPCSRSPLFSGSQITFTPSCPYTTPLRSYRLCATDNAGNTSSGITASAVPQAPDTTAPAGSLTINAGAAYTSATSATLALAATDTVGLTGYYLATSATPPAASASGSTTVA